MESNQPVEMPSSDDSYAINLGLSVIFIVFVVLAGWLYYAPLAASSVAPGNVSADLDKKTIQHLEGGKVTAIFVKDGDRVTKGETLLKLRDIQIKAQLNILNAQYQDTIALFARLQAQKENKEFIEFPKKLYDKHAIDDQLRIFETTKKTISDEKIITQSKITQIQKQINGLDALISSKEKGLSSISEEKRELEVLYKQKLVDKQKIRELKREENSIEGDLASNTAQIAKLNEQISEVKNQQLLTERNFMKEVLNKYVETKSKISDLTSKIVANEDTLERTNITSPIDGTIVGFNVHTVGAVIKPGETIMEIVPKDAKLIVIVRVPTTDIDKVKIGLLSDLIFPAFNLKKVHVIQGEVTHVAADSFIDEATKMPYYEAKIKVTKKGQEVLKKHNYVLVPGMPAQAMINIGDRTALSYFIKPLTMMLQGSLNEE